MLRVTAYGRIASKLKVKASRDGKHMYMNFLLASHEGGDTTFIRCIAFDALATTLKEYFTIGDRIIILGKLVSDDFEGQKYRYKLKVSSFEFVETLEEHNKRSEKAMQTAKLDLINKGGTP